MSKEQIKVTFKGETKTFQLVKKEKNKGSEKGSGDMEILITGAGSGKN